MINSAEAGGVSGRVVHVCHAAQYVGKMSGFPCSWLSYIDGVAARVDADGSDGDVRDGD